MPKLRAARQVMVGQGGQEGGRNVRHILPHRISDKEQLLAAGHTIEKIVQKFLFLTVVFCARSQKGQEPDASEARRTRSQ